MSDSRKKTNSLRFRSKIMIYLLFLSFFISFCYSECQKEKIHLPEALLNDTHKDLATQKLMQEFQTLYGFENLEKLQLFVNESQVQINFYFLATLDMKEKIDLPEKVKLFSLNRFHKINYNSLEPGEYETWLDSNGFTGGKTIKETQIRVYFGSALISSTDIKDGKITNEYIRE